ncbi:urease accessory protein [Haloferula helveola]|uniref:Urease accessory protein n=1 Tax=Haloferula helveola TaxID=490095 RepID=A0ABM7RDD3_9BACT|nr:urease accessory protein [Haloferula helveola]
MSRRIFIIGNGEVSRDLSDEIDASDFVIRFNQPKRSIGMTGTRTDLLFVNACDIPMKRRLDDSDYWRSPIVGAAGEVILNYNWLSLRLYGVPLRRWIRERRRYDWIEPTIAAFQAMGKPVRCLTTREYRAALRDLRTGGENPCPSTGYLGIHHFLTRLSVPDDRITICGFSFEGWRGHQWDLEKNWLRARCRRYDIAIMETSFRAEGS